MKSGREAVALGFCGFLWISCGLLLAYFAVLYGFRWSLIEFGFACLGTLEGICWFLVDIIRLFVFCAAVYVWILVFFVSLLLRCSSANIHVLAACNRCYPCYLFFFPLHLLLCFLSFSLFGITSFSPRLFHKAVEGLYISYSLLAGYFLLDFSLQSSFLCTFNAECVAMNCWALCFHFTFGFHSQSLYLLVSLLVTIEY